MLRLLSGPALLTVAIPGAVAAQSPAGTPPALRAATGAREIRLDGVLDEPAWAAADSIAGLTEVEPTEGVPPAGRTVVRVLASSGGLVIGIVADNPQGTRTVSFAKVRDADLRSEDHVRIILDTFRDGRSGYVFAVNPFAARYDALVSDRGESENANWDTVWEAATARTPGGWSAEIRIPIRSLAFAEGLERWGFNIERRVQRLQETSRWAGPQRDYQITQTSRAGLLTDLPPFDLGVGLTLRPTVTGGFGKPGPGLPIDKTMEPSLDASQRLGPNILASLTVNTDFAETEVDARQTNLTRFPLFFPEKRTFFLERADIFDFGLGLGTDVVPFFSRRIGLLAGQEVPVILGTKLNGRVGNSNLGALTVRTGEVDTLASPATVGAVRIRQNVLRESSIGGIATFGDPAGRANSWLGGVDFTYQTSRFAGNKNFLLGVWGIAMNQEGLLGDHTAAGFKVDYPNDLWDIAVTYKRIGDGFQPSLGFVPRTGVHLITFGLDYKPRPGWRPVRQMFYEFRASAVTDLDGNWESYRVFTAPLNWRLESGDRFELNVVPQGERLVDPFEVATGVTIPSGAYHYVRYRLEGESAGKRKVGGQLTWWFGGFFGGTLHQFEVEGRWSPLALVTLELTGERNVGRLPQGDFTKDLVGTRLRVNVSPDLQISGFVQWDNESRSLGTNTRLRWTFRPLGELFVVYNHNLVDSATTGLGFASNQLLIKTQYAFRY